MKILVICGPTATGKTSLAMEIARKFDGEIISADSRQVYRKMDIGTGKDIPKGSVVISSGVKIGKDYLGYYEINKVKIWGYDLVDPDKDFSVNRYVKIASKILETIIQSGKLPIIVGGTGFYIKALLDGFSTLYVPRNESLRKNLSILSADDLFEHLAQMDSLKAASLNSSDKKNPRRLVRAIEIAQWKIDRKSVTSPRKNFLKASIFFVGLRSNKDDLNKRVIERVQKRIEDGFENEARRLLSSKDLWDKQSMDSLGYRQWKDYIKGVKDRGVVVKEWIAQEKRYVKRQLTWFNKDERVVWFDINSPGYKKDIVKAVSRWHN